MRNLHKHIFVLLAIATHDPHVLVCIIVVMQSLVKGITLVADKAFEGRLTSVFPKVGLEISQLCGAVRTKVAGVWFVIGVSPYVHLHFKHTI